MLAITAEAMAARLADLDRAQPAVELVVLFGSAAKGQTRAGSDLDIAVRSDGPTDLDAVYLILTPRLGTDRLDLVDLRRAGSLLAFEVARHGRLLFERAPGVLRSFQALACRRYGDTAKLRRAQQRAIRVFLDRHGLAWVRSPRKAAERLLPEVIDAALDINAHLIAELGVSVPDEYYGGFLKLARWACCQETWRDRLPLPRGPGTASCTNTRP